MVRKMYYLILFIIVSSSLSFAQWELRPTGAQWPDGSGKAINAGWMLNSSSIVLVGSEGIILKTNDGGASWNTIVEASGDDANHINNVWFEDDDMIGYAIGNSGRIFTTLDGGESWTVTEHESGADFHGIAKAGDALFVSGTGVVIKTEDGGGSWTTLPIPNSKEEGKDLNSITFLDENVGYTGGKTNTLYRTMDGGNSWDSVNTLSGSIRHIQIIDELTLIVFGNGGIERSTDGAATFTAIETGGSVKWRAHFIDSMNGLVVGHDGFIATTNDGGASWTQEESESDEKLRAVYMLNESQAIAGGKGDHFLAKGVTPSYPTGWELRATNAQWPENSDKAINAGWMLNSSSIVLVGSEGIILKTNDGGASWNTIVEASGDDANHINNVWFEDDDMIGYAIGNSGRIFTTLDGGESWTVTEHESGADFHGIAKAGDALFVSGTGVVIKTEDGGGSWTTLPIPNSKEEGKDLNSITFLDENVGYTGGKTNTLYRTMDGGNSWDSVNTLSGSIRHIQIIDELTLIVFGNGGIERSTDGAATFTAIETGGSVKWRAHFIDSMNGLVVGHDGFIATTNDGGASWTQEESESDEKLRAVYMLNESQAIAGGKGDHFLSKGIVISSVRIDELEQLPSTYTLSQNYPNPFNPVTTIRFSITKPGNVKLNIYDVTGALVEQIVNEEMTPGTYNVSFSGIYLASGVYFYQLVANQFIQTKKMILMK